jgi:predicted transcriptional regulator
MGQVGSRRRQQIFDFLITYKQHHQGLTPLVKEIAHEVCLSESTIKYHLLILENEGRIRRVGRRALEIRGDEWEWDAGAKG